MTFDIVSFMSASGTVQGVSDIVIPDDLAVGAVQERHMEPTEVQRVRFGAF